MNYFKLGSVKLPQSYKGPLDGVDESKIVLIAYEDETGIRFRHHPNMPPEMVIQIGQKISEIGKKLQQ